MISPRPTGGSPDRDRESHHPSKAVAARVSASRAASADAESRANRLNEMPRFHRKVKSRKGVNGSESDANRSERDRTAIFAIWSTKTTTSATIPPKRGGFTAS